MGQRGGAGDEPAFSISSDDLPPVSVDPSGVVPLVVLHFHDRGDLICEGTAPVGDPPIGYQHNPGQRVGQQVDKLEAGVVLRFLCELGLPARAWASTSSRERYWAPFSQNSA